MTGLHLLIVEGDTVLSQQIANGIKKAHLHSRCTHHRTGRAALATLPHTRFDVAVVDANLSDLQPKNTVDEIIQLDPTLPVIVISDDQSDGVVGDIMRSGAVAFLAKDETLCEVLPRVVAKCRRRIDSAGQGSVTLQPVVAE